MSFFRLLFSKTFLLQLLALGVMVLLAVLVTSQFLKRYTRHSESVTVPDFRGLTYAEAVQYNKSDFFRFKVYDSTFVAGKDPHVVLDQQPSAGSKVKEHRRIYLKVNASKAPLRKLPKATGESLREARLKLSKDFQLGELIYSPHPDENLVLEMKAGGKTVKPGASLPKGTTIDLILGSGLSRGSIDIPELIGMSVYEAEFLVKSHSLNVGLIYYDDGITDTAQAVVYKQFPVSGQGGSISLGEPIDIFVTQDEKKVDHGTTNSTNDPL